LNHRWLLVVLVMGLDDRVKNWSYHPIQICSSSWDKILLGSSILIKDLWCEDKFCRGREEERTSTDELMSPALILHERLVKAFFRSYFVPPLERRAFLLQHHTLCDFHSSSIVLVKPSSR